MSQFQRDFLPTITFESNNMSLSLQNDFNFEKAAVDFASFERTYSFKPLSEITAPRYLNHVTVP